MLVIILFLLLLRVNLSSLAGKRKLVSAFGAFCQSALNNGGTWSACESSSVAYVEGELAFWAVDDVFCLGQIGLRLCVLFVLGCWCFLNVSW